MPAEMAAKAAEIGVRKAALGVVPMFVLAILAGAFIALGAAFATTVAAGAAGVLPYGVIRLLAGLAFCLGLILVIVGGAELFTGNNLLAMAWASRRISTGAVVRNWVIVYVGNLVGAVGHGDPRRGRGAVRVRGRLRRGGGARDGDDQGRLRPAAGLRPRHPLQRPRLPRGLAHVLRADDDRPDPGHRPADRRVRGDGLRALGREHVLHPGRDAHPGGRAGERSGRRSTRSPADYAALDWAGLVGNLVPVTLGNIVGGTILVGAVYWLVYLRGKR